MNRLGPHSIRTSGAMALYLNGVMEQQICILGQWKSKTWLTYIHTQIAAISASVSLVMSRPVVFRNIAVRAGPDPEEYITKGGALSPPKKINKKSIAVTTSWRYPPADPLSLLHSLRGRTSERTKSK
jgi:hypothetical protein